MQALERRAAWIPRVQMRMDADVVVDAVHRARRKHDNLISRGAISREVTHNVAGRLYIAEAEALELLREMQQRGVAQCDGHGRFIFRPQAPELARVIEELASTYAHDLVGVTDIIHSRLGKRAHQFADGFRWKKDAG